MDIILDTNIIKKDPYIIGDSFKILKDYIKKTDSSFILPRLVLDEAVGLYVRSSITKIDSLKAAINDIKRTKLIDLNIEHKPFDKEVEKSKYRTHLLEKLNIEENKVVDYNNEHLPEIIRRSIDRIKPGKEDGKQFRDISLWLTIKEHLRTNNGTKTIFISENHRDFGASNRKDLHPALITELNEEGLEVEYYTSLDDFLKQHASSIDFITDSWLTTNFKFESLQSYLETQYVFDNDVVIDKIKERLERNQEFNGYENNTQYDEAEIIDFSVFPLQSGEILIELSININIQIEYGYMELIENNYMRESITIRYHSDGSPYQDHDISPVWDFDYEQGHSSYEREITVNCIISVQDEKVTKYEFTGYD